MTQSHPPPATAQDALLDAYVVLMDAAIDPAFAAARAANPDVIPCGRGCALCCAGMFAITALDAALLRRGLRRAPDDVREAIAAEAARLLERVREAAPDWGDPWAIEAIGWREFGRIAARLDSRCPVLGPDDACLLYADRPRIARLQGVSWFDPATGDTLPDFCAEVFGDAAYAAMPPQPMPLTAHRADVTEMEMRWAAAGGRRGHTFVAAAVTSAAWDAAPVPKP